MYIDNYERLPEAPDAVKDRRVVLDAAISKIIKAVPYSEVTVPQIAVPEEVIENQGANREISDLDKIRQQIVQAINEEPVNVSEAA